MHYKKKTYKNNHTNKKEQAHIKTQTTTITNWHSHIIKNTCKQTYKETHTITHTHNHNHTNTHTQTQTYTNTPKLKRKHKDTPKHTH